MKPTQDTTKRKRPTKHQRPVNREARRGQKGKGQEREKGGHPEGDKTKRTGGPEGNEQALSFIFFALQRDVESCPGLQL